MKLSGSKVFLVLTEDASSVLAAAKVFVSDDGAHSVTVRESEDLGLWIEVLRDNGMHFVLIRWEYILAIDFPEPLKLATFGLRG